MDTNFNAALYQEEMMSLVNTAIKKLKAEHPDYTVSTISLTTDFASGVSAVHFDSRASSERYLKNEAEQYQKYLQCALPGFVDSKNEEKTERNAGYLVVSHSGGGMLRQGTRKGIRRTPANRGMRAHRIVKSLDISEDVCHGLCP